MRTKTLQILGAVTVPVLALAAFLPAPQTSIPKPHGSGRLLPELARKLDQVVRLEIRSGEGRTVLAHAASGKPDQGWTLADHANYPVPAKTIKPVLDALEKLHGVEPKTTDPKLYARIDLNDPGNGSAAHGLSFQDKNGKTLAAVILGRVKNDFAPGGHDKIYARVPGDDRTWLAEPSVTLPAEALDWADRSVVDLDPAKIRQLTITQPDGAVLTMARAKPADGLTVQNIPAGQRLKADNTSGDVPEGFQSVEFSDVARADTVKGDKGAVDTATLQDGTSVTLTLTRVKSQVWATVSASGSKAADAIHARTQGWAYQIGEAKTVPLQTKLADLIEPDPAAKAKPAAGAPSKPAQDAKPAKQAEPPKP